MSSSNKDTKLLSEQYAAMYNQLVQEGTGSGHEHKPETIKQREEDRAKFKNDPHYQALRKKMQAAYDKKKADLGEETGDDPEVEGGYPGDEAPEDNDPWAGTKWGEAEWETQTRKEETPDTLLNGGRAGNEDYTGINDLVKHFMQTNYPAEEYDELQKLLKLTHAYLMDYKEWAESKGL